MPQTGRFKRQRFIPQVPKAGRQGAADLAPDEVVLPSLCVSSRDGRQGEEEALGSFAASLENPNLHGWQRDRGSAPSGRNGLNGVLARVQGGAGPRMLLGHPDGISISHPDGISSSRPYRARSQLMHGRHLAEV